VRLLLAVATPLSDGLATDATRHGHDVVAVLASGVEVLAVIARAPAIDVAIVAANPVFLTQQVLAECDARGIRLIAVIQGDADRRFASSLGLYEFVDATADWQHYESALGGAAPPVGPARPAGRGEVVTVWGPVGAPGRTTIAIGIAAELALAGFSVALGDVDTHGASIAPALGILDESPGFAAACRLAGADALTLSELERIGHLYRVGPRQIWVLTGLGRPNRWPELSGERVTSAISVCRDWVDFTVLDTASSLENDEEISSDLFAPRRNAAALAALAEADHVVAVGAADPVGLSRFLRFHADLLEAISTDAVTTVMNKVRSSAIGVNPAAQVTQTLARFGGIPSPVIVPHDQNGVDSAVLSGETLVTAAPKSPARLAIQRLVLERILAGREVPVPTRRSRARARPVLRASN